MKMHNIIVYFNREMHKYFIHFRFFKYLLHNNNVRSYSSSIPNEDV